MRGGVGSAVRRGDRRPERGDVAGGDRGRADHRSSAAPSCSTRASRSSTSSSAPAWPPRRRRLAAPSTGAGPTSTTSGRPTPAASSARPTSCTTATWCCARAPAGSMSSGSHEAPVTGRLPRAHDRIRHRPHLVRRGRPAGLTGAPDVGLGERDRLRGADRHPHRRQRTGRQGRAQRHRRRARRLQHHRERRRDGELLVALARSRGDRPPHPGLWARGRRRAIECFDAGATDQKLLAQSRRNSIRAEALYARALERIRQIDGKVVSTTTTTDNSTGGIFG